MLQKIQENKEMLKNSEQPKTCTNKILKKSPYIPKSLSNRKSYASPSKNICTYKNQTLARKLIYQSHKIISIFQSAALG
jgi:hypothetical protein